MPSLSDTASGLDRKSLKRPDQFQSGIGGFFNNLSKNPAALVSISILVLALGAGGAVLASRGKGKETEARNAMFKARQAYDKELAALGASLSTDVKAASGAPKSNSLVKDAKKSASGQAAVSQADPTEGAAFRKVDVDSKFSESVKSYRAIAQAYDGTRTAFEAQLVLGDLYFNHGDSVKAVPYYEKATGMASGKTEKAMSEYALGYALESSGKPAEAISYYEKALKEGNLGLKGDLLLAIARSQETKQDLAQARAAYDQVLTQMPNTEYAKTAEIFKARLH